jgi:hypothetical protein
MANTLGKVMMVAACPLIEPSGNCANHLATGMIPHPDPTLMLRHQDGEMKILLEQQPSNLQPTIGRSEKKHHVRKERKKHAQASPSPSPSLSCDMGRHIKDVRHGC